VPAIPGTDEKAQATGLTIAAGGPAANAAITASALGAEVTLVTAVGSHPLGDLVREELRRRRVGLIDVDPRFAGPPPVSAVLVRTPTGERTIVSRNAGDRTVRAPETALPDADVTLVDGHHPALAVAATQTARRLLVDAGSWRPVFADVFPYAEVVACSAAFRHPEATPPALETPTSPAAGVARGRRFARDAATARAVGAPFVAVTHGPDPVTWFAGGESGEIEVPKVAAVDTAGAGDAFHGALAVSLARGDDFPAALNAAVRVAGVRVVHRGPRAWLETLAPSAE
jgi:sugar/nucleoside kinase (ribokinase family)